MREKSAAGTTWKRGLLLFRNMKHTPNYLRAAFALLAAALCALTGRADEINLAWSFAPGEEGRTWLGTGNNERGMAFNPATGHVLVASRTAPISVRILDAATGADILNPDETPKLLNLAGVTGGTFIISQIRCAADGAIYAANLTTASPTNPFKVYRWDNEDAAPFVVYSGNPGNATLVRWGDTFNVRGAGNTTQLIAGAGAPGGTTYPHAAIFTTTDEGVNFTSTLLDGVAETGGMQGICFGPGDTIFVKRAAGPLRHVSFDLAAGTATLLNSFTIGAVGPIHYSGKYLAGFTIETPDRARVYDVSDLPNAPVLVGQLPFETDNANGNNAGAVDIGGGRAYFLDTNNGLLAANIIERTDPVVIVTPPANQMVFTGGSVTFSVTASGTPPLRYQWYFGDTRLEGQTATTLALSNLTPAQSGTYRVEVTNPIGPVPASATLTVMDPPDTAYLTDAWQIRPGQAGYDYILNDINSRGIAYNPVTGHLLVMSRVPAAAVHVLDAATGAPVMDGDVARKLDLTGVTGGNPSNFILNMIGVAEDGVIYGANLTTDASGTAYKVYRWMTETSAPEVVYAGNPSNAAARPEDRRFGDTLDVRGSGVNTQILATSRNGKVAAVIFPDTAVENYFAAAINFPDMPDGHMGHGVAWAEGNSFFTDSTVGPLRKVTFPALVPFESFNVEGTIEKTFPATEVWISISHIAYQPSTRLLAGNALETPDNVRLHRIAEDLTATLLDVEFLNGLDNANGNGTGSLDFSSNMLFSMNTQNGLIAFHLNTNPVEVAPADLDAPMINGDGSVMIHFTGTANTAYTVEVSTDLVTWAAVGQPVTTDAGGMGVFTETPPAGTTQRFYRVVKR